jgi:transcriptional regulator with XRE-family HTH domain
MSSATMSETLRRAVRGAPSIRSLARDAGLACAVVSRFRAGGRSVTLETASRLAGALNLTLEGSSNYEQPTEPPHAG